MNPAIVTVYMNGSVVKTMRLPPGRHSIEDFPFLSGLNSLSIEIREEGSPVRIEQFSVSFDANLLPRGETAFFAGVAVPQWDTEPLLLLGFFRFGAAETLTLGIHAESSLDSGIYGLEAIWASPLGNLKAEGGFRFDPEVFDYGYQLQYRFSLAGRTRLPVIALGARYDGAEYAGPGTADAVNPYAWQINAVASKSFGTAFGMNLGAVYKVGRERSDTLSFSLGLNKSFGLGVSLNFSAEAVTRDEGGFGYRGSVSLLAAPPAKREVLSLNQDLVGGDSSIDFQVRPKTSIGSAGYSFSLGGLPYGAGYPAYLRGGIQYSGRYFEGSFSDTFSQDPEGI
jgi:outer membrane usher protein FimD/PapC